MIKGVVDQRVTLGFKRSQVGQLDPVDETRGFTVIPAAPADRLPETDRWCECHLTPPEGFWEIYEGGGVECLSSNPACTAKVGNYYMQIYAVGPAFPGWVAGGFTLNSGYEVDGNTWRSLNFWIRRTLPLGSPTGLFVILIDVNGNMVQQIIGPFELAVWYLISVDIGNLASADWTPDPNNTAPFDWTAIKTVSWWQEIAEGSWGQVQLDDLYFARTAGMLKLSIRAYAQDQEINVKFKVDGLERTTPWEGLASSGDHVVEMDPENFVEWEDGTTNPVRTINIQTDTEIVAYYSTVPPDEWWKILLFAGMIVSSVVVVSALGEV